MTPSDATTNIERENCYTLGTGNTVTVEGCPFCDKTHVFSIEPEWVTIQKSHGQAPTLPDGVKKFVVECPIQHSLFEIYVDVGVLD